MLYVWEISSLRDEYVHLEVSDRRYLPSFHRVIWNDRTNNVHVSNRVLEAGSENVLPQRTKLSKPGGLGLVAYGEHPSTTLLTTQLKELRGDR